MTEVMVSYLILTIGCVAAIFSVAVLVSVIRDYRVEKEHRRHMAKVYGASLARRREILHGVLGNIEQKECANDAN